MKPSLRGLYAVTPDEADTRRLEALVGAALRGGAAVVQYRNKSADPALRLEQAQMLRSLCDGAHVPLIINDHLDLAIEVGAHGLHVGRDDGSLGAARSALGAEKIIGVSCYNVLADALNAQAGGADYVAFGSFFASSVKPGAVVAPLDLLQSAHRVLHLPVVAIGGITLANAGQLVAAGADAVAVITALFSASDVEAAARQFSALFPTSR
jgi:thiamine-phosphate pyrophosphorylase